MTVTEGVFLVIWAYKL